MRVLTIYAHHNANSFCHALLDRFCEGLRDTGHENEVLDLHAMHFDPVLRAEDGPNWIDNSVPDDVLANMKPRESLLAGVSGPLRRWQVKRFLDGLDARGIARKLHALGGPEDVRTIQAKMARAEGLAFVSPVYFMGFPAILKGFIERVFTPGFAFGLAASAWRGDMNGKRPLLSHRKALIMQTTLFDQKSYEAGFAAAVEKVVDEYCLKYPGVESVEHVYFYAVHGADDAQRRRYLDRAYQLGRDFAPAPVTAKKRPALAADARTLDQLQRRSLSNLARMGHCAPTVMQTLLDVSERDSPWLVKLAAGLPGGIGNLGAECGAITASLVALGLVSGEECDQNGIPQVVRKGQALVRDFAKRHGSHECRTIRGAERLPVRCVGAIRHGTLLCARAMSDDTAALDDAKSEAYAQLCRHWQERGFHCAHAVLGTVPSLASNTRELFDATSGFLGGTVLLGLTCSALTAGVMALGLSRGKIERRRLKVLQMVGTMTAGGDVLRPDLNAFNETLHAANRLVRRFESEFGSTSCRALTGCDFARVDDVQRYVADDGTRLCKARAAWVVEQVEVMLDRRASPTTTVASDGQLNSRAGAHTAEEVT